MITYYIGNVKQKREWFRMRRAGAALADNGDVLADFRWRGKVCFVMGDIPFGNMRVGEYLAYARALKTDTSLSGVQAARLLRKAGIKADPRKKMAALPREIYRAVLLAAALEEDTRTVWLNFDGIAYRRRVARRIHAVLRRLNRSFAEVHASVSDYRFIPKKARTVTAANGVLRLGRVKSASRPFGRFYVRRARRNSDLILDALNGKKALLCDN